VNGLGCAAFPDGIPMELRHTHKVHNTHYPGDHGIIFAQDPNIKFIFPIEEAAKEQRLRDLSRHRERS
jgi:hypothetical protein